MTLRASGFVVLSSSAADGRVPGLVLLLFFWSRALKSSFLLEDFPVLPAAAGDSLVGEPEVFTGESELGRLPKGSPGSFRPKTFLFDLGTKETRGESSLRRELLLLWMGRGPTASGAMPAWLWLCPLRRGKKTTHAWQAMHLAAGKCSLGH